MLPVESRVTELEDLLAALLRAQERTQRELDQLSREMREFKTEMRESNARTEADTREFKNEMREFKKDMNRRWGELANKMGTLAEDIVAPSVPRILRSVAQCPPEELDYSAVRVRRRHAADSGRTHEFDVVAACRDYVLLNETKPRLNPAYIDDFVRTLADVRGFFPEYADRKIIGAIAALYVDESIVRYGEKQGILVLGLGDDLMDILNSPGFVPREF